jgi:SAM-dependent methyltransferase
MFPHYSSLSDKDWLETLAASLSDASLGLPGFPSPQVQANFTGRSWRPALEEAFEFYTLVKSSVASLAGPILDFGCEWGRILRFFLKDLDQKYIHGVDVEPSAIAECRDTKVPGDIQLIAPHGSLSFSNDTFQIVYAYSVFTHLPEQAAAHWMHEIKRVLKPEGRIVFTALPGISGYAWNTRTSHRPHGNVRLQTDFQTRSIFSPCTRKGSSFTPRRRKGVRQSPH